MTCTHRFAEIQQISKPTKGQLPGTNEGSTSQPIQFPNAPLRFADTFGVRVGCLNCGEIRSVWETGELTIEIPGKELNVSDTPSTT